METLYSEDDFNIAIETEYSEDDFNIAIETENDFNIAIETENGDESLELVEDINDEAKASMEEDEEKWSCANKTLLQANCKLEMHIESKNKVIYVYPGKVQYFLASSSKSCGAVSVKYIGPNYNKRCSKVRGILGSYYILNAGILFVPKKCLKPGKIDILPLLAFDGCNYYNFEAVFNYDPCRYRNK